METIGCSGMTHSAAMASEILIGKTLLEANTDLVCDAINTAMRELFLQIVYGRSQTAFSEGGLPVGASLEDLGKGLRSQVGTMFATKEKGPRYLEMAEGYCTRVALNKDDEIIGYEFVNLGKMMESVKEGHGRQRGTGERQSLTTVSGTAYIDPRQGIEEIAFAIRKQSKSIPVRNEIPFSLRRNWKWLCLKATREESRKSIRPVSARNLQRGGVPGDLQAAGFDPYEIVKGIQPICFENACWAYCVGAAIALKKNVQTAAEAAEAIGIGLQSFCIPGSVAEDRKVGLGHGNLGAMLLRDETKCFAFLAGHESFAAAEGAIGIVRNANKARKEPLRVILNGLGKDAAQIISRINGFTYVQTQFDYYTGELKTVREVAYSDGERAAVRCYGCDDVREGVAVMHHEGVDVSITGNSTNPTRFQHPVAGTYKKECIEQGKKYFSVASGGGTGRTLHPDNMAAGPASYGMTDTMGRMHSDAQFAGSSSVPAHVEMMGFLGMGNNPMVGATVAVAVAVAESKKQKRKVLKS